MNGFLWKTLYLPESYALVVVGVINLYIKNYVWPVILFPCCEPSQVECVSFNFKALYIICFYVQGKNFKETNIFRQRLDVWKSTAFMFRQTFSTKEIHGQFTRCRIYTQKISY